MALPLRNEDKLYDDLKRDKVKVDSRIWELINHHVRNDLNLVTVVLGTLYLTPSWILRIASCIIRFLYRLSFKPGEPPPRLDKICDRSLKGVKDVDKFLKKLYSITVEERND